MSKVETKQYKAFASAALEDEILQKALSGFQNRLGPATRARYEGQPEGLALREMGYEIRRRAIDNLDILLERLSDTIRKNGGNVFFARTAEEAVEYGLSIAERNGVKRVVKGKSMVTEEIGLNDALEARGIETVETDLGEYIIQLAHEKPSHIIAPAIHKTRGQVGELFSEKLGIPYTDDPETLTWAARKALREKFLTADMGVTGCNLACAETGHITTVSNEGNIRMATTLPRVHMAFMGMERIVARLADHQVLFRLLSNAAAAQEMAGYISYIGGPAYADQIDGPNEFHLVILDNGRSRILADPEFREMLCCIRCAACLNVCPVYGKIGGHSYGYAYSGPVGSVVTPLLVGIDRARDLCTGETLCGACRDACPVGINIPRMLLALRRKVAEGDPTWGATPESNLMRGAFDLWSRVVEKPALYETALRGAGIAQHMLPNAGGMIRRLPWPMSGWTRGRDLQPLAGERFVTRWNREKRRGGSHGDK